MLTRLRPIICLISLHLACPSVAAASADRPLLQALATLSSSQPAERWNAALDYLHDHPDERSIGVLEGFAAGRGVAEEVRRQALRALSRLDHHRAHATLARVAKGDPSPLMREAAAYALKHHPHTVRTDKAPGAALDDASTVELLIQARTGSPVQRAGALGGLAASGRVDVLPVLEAAVRQEEGPVAEAALSSIGRRSDPASAESLRTIWRDGAAPPDRRRGALVRLVSRPDTAAIDAAFEELESQGDSADPQALAQARRRWGAAHPARAKARSRALGRADKAAASEDVLIEALLLTRAPTDWQRVRGTSWLAESADPALVPVLTDIATRGTSTAQRMRGVRGLVAARTPEARRALAQLAKGDAVSDPVAYAAKKASLLLPPPDEPAVAQPAPPQPAVSTPDVADPAAVAPAVQAPTSDAADAVAELPPPPPVPDAEATAEPTVPAPPAAAPAQPAVAAAPDTPTAPVASGPQPVGPVAAAEPAVVEPPKPPDPRAGIGLLAVSSAILGSVWLESLGDAAQQDRQSWERWVAVSSGALLGGGSALLVTLRSDVSSAEAGWFASMGGMATAAGWMLPTGLGIDAHSPAFNFTLMGLETAGLVGGALTMSRSGLDTDGILFMDASAAVGAATGLGVALQFPSTGQPHKAFLPVTGGMLLGAAGGYLGARGPDLNSAERGVLTFSVLNSAAAGVLAASAFNTPEGLEREDNRQLLGGALIGGGLGFGVGVAAGQLADPDGGDMVRTALGEGIGLAFGLGAGLLAPGLEARRVRGTALFGAGAGALGGVLIGPHIKLEGPDTPLLMLGAASGVTTGLLLGDALDSGPDRALGGGLLAGASAGLIGAGALAQKGIRRTAEQAAIASAAGAVGGFGGQGISLLFDDPDPWAVFALRAGGYGSYLLVADRLDLKGEDTPVVMLGGAEGIATGLLLHDALEGPSAGAAMMTGFAGGMALGGVGSELWKPSAGRAAGIGAAGGVGLLGGWGWNLLDAERDDSESAWVSLAGMWGLSALYSQLDIDSDDAPLLLLGAPMSMTTGWLLAEAAGVSEDGRQSGAALMGLTAAATVLGPASQVVELSVDQSVQAAVGGGLGLLGGLGVELEQELSPADGALAQVGAMWGSAALWSQFDLQDDAAPVMALGTMVGAGTELLGARAMGVRDDRRLLGSTLAGGSWAATGSAALSHWWRPSGTEALIMGTTGVTGLLAGDGMARLIKDTDGDNVAAGQLVGMWAGLGVGRLVRPVPHTLPVSAFAGLVGGGTGLLLTQAWGVRESRRKTGGASLGLWSGGLAGALIAPHIGYDPARAARLITGGVSGLIGGYGLADHFDDAGDRAYASGRLAGMWAGLAAGAGSEATSEDIAWVMLTGLTGSATEALVNHGRDESRFPGLGLGVGALGGLLSGGRLSLGTADSAVAGAYGAAGLVAGAAWGDLHAGDDAVATRAALNLGGMWTGLVIGGGVPPGSGDAGFLAGATLWSALAVEHLERGIGGDDTAAALFAGGASGLMASTLIASRLRVPGGRALLATAAGGVGSVGGLGAAWLLNESSTEDEGRGQLAGLVAGTLIGSTLKIEGEDSALIILGGILGARTTYNLGLAADDLNGEQKDGAALLGASTGLLATAAATRAWSPTGSQLGRATVAGLVGLAGSAGSRQAFPDADPGALALGEIGATWAGMAIGYGVDPTAADAPLMLLSAGAAAATAGLLTDATGIPDDERQGGAMLMGLSAGTLGGWALSDRYEPTSSQALLTGSGGLAGWLLADGGGRLFDPDDEQSQARAGLVGMWSGLLGAGLVLEPWEIDGTGKLAMGLLTTGGALHGLGWGSVLEVQGDRLRGAIELGAVAGLLGGAWVSRDPKLTGRRVLEVGGGNALGALVGGLSVGVFLPELGREGALATSLVASYAGTVVGVLRPNQPSAFAMAAAGGTLGFVAGHGGVRLLTELDQDSGTVVAAAGVTGGLLAGGLLVAPWDVTLGDAVVMATAASYGGLQGYGWAEVADVSGRRKRGASELGVAVGTAGGTWLAQAYDLDRSTVVLTLGTASALMSMASGLSLLTEDTSAKLKPEHEKDYDNAIGAGLSLSAVGLAGGALLSRHLSLDSSELATTSVGAVWGVAQGSTWAAATGAGTRKGAGAVLLGTGLGGVAGAILAENVNVNLYRSLVLGSGAVWGGWLGLGATYATGVPWQQSVVGGLAVANAGIVGGLALASRTESLAQVGWVNLFGLAGTGVGTAIGVAVTSNPRGRVTSMIGGSVLGLAGGIVGTAYSDWWRVPGPAPAANSERSGVRAHTSSGLLRMLKTTEDAAIVMPGVTWLPPKDGQGEPSPVLQVTVLH